jgi:hypothetical protein
MGCRSRSARVAAMTSAVLTGLALAAPSAGAVFHLMKVREVYLGSAGASYNDAFIELQMYAAGQNQVGGHAVNYYGAAGGSPAGSIPIDNNVPNGDNQRTILIGDTSVPGSDVSNAQSGQLGDGIHVYAGGGAVCFENIDCVSWGGFTGAASLPSPTGNPAPAIPDGSSLERSIAPNCATLLEGPDDTDNSLADFFVATPWPRNNAATPTETPCTGAPNPGGGPNTTITKGPKKKTKKKEATFEFTSDIPGATFECSLDGKTFTPCTSPHEVKVKKGKHSFEVRAVLNGTPDGSPAEQDWKVKKKRKK